MPSWNDNQANLPDREAAIRAELTATGAGIIPTLSQVLTTSSDAGSSTITNLGSPIQSTDAATKGYVDTNAGGGTPSLLSVLGVGNDAGGLKIAGLGSPGVSTDAATKAYVDALTFTLAQVLIAGSDAGGNRITNLGVPSASTDAATKAYVDALTFTLQQVLAAGANANGVTITNAGAPTNQSDVATKNYVDTSTFNNQSVSYTLVATDIGKTVNFTASTAVTLTVPPNSSVPFSVSPPAVIYVAQGGTGTVTIAGGTGVTIVNPYSSFTTAARYAEVKLTKIGTDSWRLNGEVT